MSTAGRPGRGRTPRLVAPASASASAMAGEPVTLRTPAAACTEPSCGYPRIAPGRAGATRLVWRVAGRGSYRCQVTPEAVTVAVWPFWCTIVWCLGQSRARFDRSVGPPSHQCHTWWASHQDGGLEQPGKVHPRSRSHRACSCFGVTSRVVRPRSRTSDLVPEDDRDDRGVAGDLTHGLRRQELPGQGAPGAGALLQILIVHGHEQRGLGRGRRGPAGRGARRTISIRASARLWSLVRRSDPCLVPGLGCGERAEHRLQHRRPFRVEAEVVLQHPVVGVRLGQPPAVLEPVLAALELAQVPVLGDQGGAQRRI